MAVLRGTHTFGPDRGRLLMMTRRAGLGRWTGGLTMEATRWRGRAVVDGELGSSVAIDIDVSSFEVRADNAAVLRANRREIERLLRERILRAGDHPTISFRSTRVRGTPESFTIDGGLTVMGRTEPIRVRCDGSGGRVRGALTLDQTRWGITPHRALFGAFRVADEVRIEFGITL